ncbi:hypothetical protein GGR56DRAFT_666173 [Xylariaceae sp. FL0804]|nr:hypothetical protein GGR56DRAFT_666173 [Xylariaceae sp. FL0804]
MSGRYERVKRRRQGVDPALADAFDTDGDDSDEEPDDRQRLVRGNSFPISTAATTTMTPARSPGGQARPAPVERQTTQWPSPETSNSVQPNANARVYGGGIQSDGVFSNMTARPERGEKVVEEAPPTYEQAAADAAPPYWETTILAPGLGGPDDVFIDGMPVGSIFSFVWNGMISMSFQLVGFLLTYLLHSTHAAKNGSRAGLGITLIQYGFYMKGTADSDGMSGGTSDGYAQPPDPNSHDFDPNAVSTGGGEGGGSALSDIASSEWVSYILMIVGWFILIRAVSDYIKARRHEQLVLQSPDRGLGIPIIAEGEAAETVVYTGTSNASLVANLWRNGLVTQPAVREALGRVDRAHYVSPRGQSSAYEDAPQPIGHAATISAPHMHASAAEALLPLVVPPATGGGDDGDNKQPGRHQRPSRPRRILDVGSGSGYLTHVLAELARGGDDAGAEAGTGAGAGAAAPAAGADFLVVGLEHIPELRDLGERNMAKSASGRALLASGRVRFRLGDGRRGWREPADEPDQSENGDREEEKDEGWDAIHVGAAAAHLHRELVDQLRCPGRMFIPVEDDEEEEEGGGGGGWSGGNQCVWTVDKDARGNVVKKRLYGVRYVPLTDAPAR